MLRSGDDPSDCRGNASGGPGLFVIPLRAPNQRPPFADVVKNWIPGPFRVCPIQLNFIGRSPCVRTKKGLYSRPSRKVRPAWLLSSTAVSRRGLCEITEEFVPLLLPSPSPP